MEARRQNINEKDNGLFSGDGKDSSSRCETTEESVGPGWNTPGRRETKSQQEKNAEPINARLRPERTESPSHVLLAMRWLRAPRHTVCSTVTVALTSCCSRKKLTLSLYPRNSPKPMRLSGMRSYVWSSCLRRWQGRSNNEAECQNNPGSMQP